MRRKLLPLLLFFITTLAFQSIVSASEGKSEVNNTRPSIYLDGLQYQALYDPRSGGLDYLIAVTDIARCTGAVYQFYPGGGEVIINKGDKTLQLFMDSQRAFINGRETAILQPPRTEDGVIYVPLSLTATSLGYTVKAERPGPKFSLYSPPLKEGSQESRPVKSPADFLPAGAEFVAIPSASEEITKNADLDGDGNIEYAAFYKGPADKSGIILYRQINNQYIKIWQKEGFFNPQYLDMVDLTGGGPSLAVGWSLGEPLGLCLEIYQLKENTPALLYSNLYNRFEPGDFDGDGKNEFALWQRDAGETYETTVYKWDGKSFKPLEYCPGYYVRVADYYGKLSETIFDKRPLYYRIAEVNLRAKKFDQALKYSFMGMNLPSDYPANSSFQSLRGLALTGLGKYPEALPLLTSAAEGFPGPVWPQSRYALALCYIKTGNENRGNLELVRAVNEGNDWPGFGIALSLLENIINEKSRPRL